jgi:hypothetical protein
MTAYVSRLFPTPGLSAGIRKRPRSRYEPEPDTFLGSRPIDVNLESGDQQLPSGRGRANTSYRRHAADAATTPGALSEPGSGQAFSADASPAAAATGAVTPPPVPPGQLNVERVPDSDILHDPGLTSPASISDAPAAGIAPPDARRSDDVGALAHPAIPPAAIADPGREQRVQARHEGRQSHRDPTPETWDPAVRTSPPPHSQPNTAPTGSAGSVSASTDTPAHPGQSVVYGSPKPDPIRAGLAGPNIKTPDPAVRQRISEAVAEPVRVQGSEVVVNIDRIDVRAQAGTPTAAPEPRRARAAPTSLESYLRSKSRGSAR